MENHSPINVFIAYSRKDKEYLEEFLFYLKVLNYAETPVKIWCDREIDAGAEWKKEIETELETADVFLLLVSQYFTASDFCMSIEMKRAIERHKEGTAKVVPVIIRKCNWHLTMLSQLQAPVGGKPIRENQTIESDLYTGIVDEVYGVVQGIKTKRELVRLQAEEDAFWQKAKAVNRLQDYRSYIKTYPNGKYIEDAKRGIQAIEAKQEQAYLAQLQAEEDAFWEKTKEENTIAAYDQYLKKYQNGKYTTAALNAKQTIQQKILEAARAKDLAFWQEVKQSNTKESYEAYLAKYPDGLHHVEAKSAIQKMTLLLPELVFVRGGKDTNGNTIQDFWIGKYQVTNQEYAFFLNRYGSDKVKAGEYKGQKMVTAYEWGVQQQNNQWLPAKGYEQYPIVYVNWYGANEYCNWLKQETGENYQLPDEWHWEWAARGGQQSKGYEYAGSNDINEVAWYDKNSYDKGESHPDYGTHRVGEKKANELGLYDMSGNVWEWCANWYDEKEAYRVLRGGCWLYGARYCRSAYRGNSTPVNRGNANGFRVVFVPQFII